MPCVGPLPLKSSLYERQGRGPTLVCLSVSVTVVDSRFVGCGGLSGRGCASPRRAKRAALYRRRMGAGATRLGGTLAARPQRAGRPTELALSYCSTGTWPWVCGVTRAFPLSLALRGACALIAVAPGPAAFRCALSARVRPCCLRAQKLRVRRVRSWSKGWRVQAGGGEAASA